MYKIPSMFSPDLDVEKPGKKKEEKELFVFLVTHSFVLPLSHECWYPCEREKIYKLLLFSEYLQTLVRYQLPVVVIVFNNGGVYGGDRRNPEDITGPFKDDPALTSFVPGATYHTLIEAFGGRGYIVGTPQELKSALTESFSAWKPAVINVTIDPYAGLESGRMQHKN